MSASQIVLIILVVIAFGVGWFARGRREGDGATGARIRALDAALRSVLTSFQAVLGLWQGGEPATSPLARRAQESFEERCAAAVELMGRDESHLASASIPALRSARAELERLALELGAYASSAELDRPRERAVVSAERRLAFARSALLRTLAGIEP